MTKWLVAAALAAVSMAAGAGDLSGAGAPAQQAKATIAVDGVVAYEPALTEIFDGCAWPVWGC